MIFFYAVQVLLLHGIRVRVRPKGKCQCCWDRMGGLLSTVWGCFVALGRLLLETRRPAAPSPMH